MRTTRSDRFTIELYERSLVAGQPTNEEIQSSYVHRVYLLRDRRSEASTNSNSIVSCEVPFLCEGR